MPVNDSLPRRLLGSHDSSTRAPDILKEPSKSGSLRNIAISLGAWRKEKDIRSQVLSLRVNLLVNTIEKYPTIQWIISKLLPPL
jgi:hypothetical protein